ncbi:hypothetical protein LOAG_02362 [Loa loa]|uniref:Uncharacterized protein n=1 Tax=Loa loa TaxID=7209 RepID=A0A1S0U774_LOALO|nr:hypothetical protein LOAG_02362 [Loa loa]EFO26128.1 hypothetical protein LOAG_02362 [Loa loa]
MTLSCRFLRLLVNTKCFENQGEEGENQASNIIGIQFIDSMGYMMDSRYEFTSVLNEFNNNFSAMICLDDESVSTFFTSSKMKAYKQSDRLFRLANPFVHSIRRLSSTDRYMKEEDNCTGAADIKLADGFEP